MAQHPAPPAPRSILVVGGCGFLGQQIVHSLLYQAKAFPPPKISVTDLNTPINPHAGVAYHTCSITSLSRLQKLISIIKPQVIIHTASALPGVCPTTDADDVELFTKVNVEGTDNLLECARDEASVEVFVYTSSAAILQRKESYMAVEDAVVSEVQINISRFDPYSGTKGIADTLVSPFPLFMILFSMCLNTLVLISQRSSSPIIEVPLRNVDYALAVSESVGCTALEI